MNNNNFISVIIPVYNTEKYITEALDSVFAQDYKNLEVIVVNDGSTDSTLDILEKYPKKIKIISQENKGQSVARNVGIREAKGSIIGFLDADDVLPNNYISLAIEYLGEDSEYDFVRGQTRYFRLVDGKKEMTDNVFLDMMVGASLYKAKIFDIVGLFDSKIRLGEDLDWSIRATESNCKEKRIEETMLFYRRHENNMTNAKESIARGQINAFRKKIERRKSSQFS